jgi:hypothetical protein
MIFREYIRDAGSVTHFAIFNKTEACYHELLCIKVCCEVDMRKATIFPEEMAVVRRHHEIKEREVAQ